MPEISVGDLLLTIGDLYVQLQAEKSANALLQQQLDELRAIKAEKSDG